MAWQGAGGACVARREGNRVGQPVCLQAQFQRWQRWQAKFHRCTLWHVMPSCDVCLI